MQTYTACSKSTTKKKSAPSTRTKNRSATTSQAGTSLRQTQTIKASSESLLNSGENLAATEKQPWGTVLSNVIQHQAVNTHSAELTRQLKRKNIQNLNAPVIQLASAKATTHSNTTPKRQLRSQQQTSSQSGLPTRLKAGIESLSGYSMDAVKVHYNSPKPSRLQAHAYTQGADIHVAPGQEKHLPHEAWHVVQQMQGKVKPTVQRKGIGNINTSRKLEKEADVMGEKSASIGIFKPLNKISLKVPTNAYALSSSNEPIQFKKNSEKRTQDLEQIAQSLTGLIETKKWKTAAKQIQRAVGKLINLSKDDSANEDLKDRAWQAFRKIVNSYRNNEILKLHIKVIDFTGKSSLFLNSVKLTGGYTSVANAGGMSAASRVAEESTEFSSDDREVSSSGTGISIFGAGAAIARAVQAFNDISKGGSAGAAARANLTLASIKATQSGAAIADKAYNATAAAVTASTGGAIAAAVVAGRNARQAYNAINRAERIADLSPQSRLAKTVKGDIQKASKRKAVIKGITAQGASVAATGATLIALSASPIGWAIAAFGALTGVSIGAYRLYRWAKHWYERGQRAKELVMAFHGETGLETPTRKGSAVSTERLTPEQATIAIQNLGIEPLDAFKQMDAHSQEILLKTAIKRDKDRISITLYEIYKSTIEELESNGLDSRMLTESKVETLEISQEQKDVLNLVHRIWNGQTESDKRLKKDGKLKVNGWKEIRRKFKST